MPGAFVGDEHALFRAVTGNLPEPLAGQLLRLLA